MTRPPAKKVVLAKVENHFSTATDIAERAGVHYQTALEHLWAAEAEGLIEMQEEIRDDGGAVSYLWRRRNGA